MNEHMSILTIDDDITIGTLLENAFSNKDFQVYTATSGPDGLDIAKHADIDVILLDWLMPDMNGIEVLAELKRDCKTMFIPVFMLTAKEDAKDREIAISKGATGYIIKPFNLYEVPAMVTAHLLKNGIAAHCRKGNHTKKLFSHSS